MIRRAWLLGMLVFLLCTPSLAWAATAGTITGQVVNGTEGGGAVANQTLTLKTYRGADEIASATAQTDEAGRFQFEGLATEDDYLYKILLDYHQAQYESDWVDFRNGEANQFIVVTVYDSTAKDGAIEILAAHTIIYPEGDKLFVKEYYLFSNKGDRAYIGSDGKTLRFGLPAGATDLTFTLGLMECCISDQTDGFADTMAVIPGEREVAFSYSVPAPSSRTALSRAILYPLASYDLLLAGKSLQISSPQLTARESIEISGTIYQRLSGQGLSPGTVLDIQLSGLGGNESRLSWVWTVAGVLVLMAGLASVYWVRRRYRLAALTSTSASAAGKSLLLKLAQLDDDFEAGRLSEAEYKERRSSLKGQLQQLWLGSQGKRD